MDGERRPDMRNRFLFLPVAAIVAAAYTLRADVGDVLAETSSPAEFEVYTTADATYAATSDDDISALLVSYCKGETVTARARDGAVVMLVEAALTAGSVRFSPDKGGVWSLENSVQGRARIGVAWSVFDDGGDLAESGVSSMFGVDSKQEGWGRRIRKEDVFPVSYTGDGWLGDTSKESHFAVVTPDGKETSYSFSGTGTESFPFDKLGRWAFKLQMADGTELEASVLVLGGFVLTFR